jgi:hypothetical protein
MKTDDELLRGRVSLTNRLWYLNWALFAASVVAAVPGTSELEAPGIGVRLQPASAQPLITAVSLLMLVASIRSSIYWIGDVAQMRPSERPISLLYSRGALSAVRVEMWLYLPTAAIIILPMSQRDWPGTTLGILTLALVWLIVSTANGDLSHWEHPRANTYFAGYLDRYPRMTLIALLIYLPSFRGYTELVGNRVDDVATKRWWWCVLSLCVASRLTLLVFHRRINMFGAKRYGFARPSPEFATEKQGKNPAFKRNRSGRKNLLRRGGVKQPRHP